MKKVLFVLLTIVAMASTTIDAKSVSKTPVGCWSYMDESKPDTAIANGELQDTLVVIYRTNYDSLILCKKGVGILEYRITKRFVATTEDGFQKVFEFVDEYRIRFGWKHKNGIVQILSCSPDVACTHVERTFDKLAGLNTLPRSEFDVRSVRAGKEYFCLQRADSTGEEHLCYFIYIQDIRRTVVLHMTDSMHVEKQEKPLEVIPKHAEVVIESSLWNAMAGNNLPITLALELSEIYAWTIDFFGLQKGDSIRVYYDEQFVDSVSVGIGRIYAANFYHGGKWQDAYYFEAGDVHSYFNSKGESLRKAFLKAPLNYKRISSHFTYARKHPIFKTVRPHTGVDYAAPAGTPVVSIGDGVVIEKGYKGGGGNTVKIRHNSTYTTAYLHLSKYGQGIAVGKHVNQGQVIGYVGSTGNSTGPHLDFRIWKNGTPIDPLKMVSPPSEPVPAKYRAEFDSIVTQYSIELKR